MQPDPRQKPFPPLGKDSPAPGEVARSARRGTGGCERSEQTDEGYLWRDATVLRPHQSPSVTAVPHFVTCGDISPRNGENPSRPGEAFRGKLIPVETLPLPLPRGWSWCILNGTVCAPCVLQILPFPADAAAAPPCWLPPAAAFWRWETPPLWSFLSTEALRCSAPGTTPPRGVCPCSWAAPAVRSALCNKDPCIFWRSLCPATPCFPSVRRSSI